MEVICKMDNKPASVDITRNCVRSSAAWTRLSTLFDVGSINELDPLQLSEGKPAEAITAYGQVGGVGVCAFAQNAEIAGGAVSRASAAKINKILDYALCMGSPIIGIYDSSGARLKQGLSVLGAVGEILQKMNSLSGVVPQIAIIAGSCVGTSALLASAADIVICCEDAEFGIETSGGNMNAKQAVEAGCAHITAKDPIEAIAIAQNLIAMLPCNNLDDPALCEYSEPSVFPAASAALKIGTGEKVAHEICSGVFDLGSIIEFGQGYAEGVTTALATIEGLTVGVVLTECTDESKYLDADGAAKIAKFVRFCDAFSVPVATFLDCEGFKSVREAAMLTNAYADSTTAKIVVVTGSAYGSAYIAMAGKSSGADYVMAWPTAVISPLAPETIAAIMYSEQLDDVQDPIAMRAQQIEEYKKTVASPYNAAQAGHIQDVVEPSETRARLIKAINMFSGKRVPGRPRKHSNIQM